MNRAVLGRITLLIVLLVAIALAALYRDQLDVEAVTRWIGEAGPGAPLLFMALYALATVLFLPGSVMTLIGGALFGPLLGTVYNLTAATLGAAIAFLVARHLAADWVERKVAGRTRQLIDGVEAEGWRFVAFTRLVPLFPFNLLNYGLGLTRIPFSHYLLTSCICMLPGSFAYTYLGYVGREAVSGEQDIIQKVLLALAVLAFVGFLPRFIGRLRRGADITVEALQHQLTLPDPPLLLDVRERNEFCGEHGHITGAINLPLDKLERDIDQFSSHMEKPVALVCRRESVPSRRRACSPVTASGNCTWSRAAWRLGMLQACRWSEIPEGSHSPPGTACPFCALDQTAVITPSVFGLSFSSDPEPGLRISTEQNFHGAPAIRQIKVGRDAPLPS